MVAIVLDTLVEEALQSDDRFTQAFVDSRIARGQGPLRIRVDLSRRGIGKDLCSMHLGDSHEVWVARVQEVRRRRFGEDPPESGGAAAKQARFLAGRGFTREQVRAALRAASRC